MEFDDTRQQWLATQAAAAQAEERLNRRIAEFLRGAGQMPDRKDFLELRFLRTSALQLLEQALQAKLGSSAIHWVQPAYPVGSAGEADAQSLPLP